MRLNKKLLFSLLFLSLFSAIYANTEGVKGKISGTVLSEDQIPAEGITVYLKNTKYGTITNANGYFQFSAPAGEYTIVYYSILAHKQEIEHVVVKESETNKMPTITLREKQNMLGEIVVTGQFHPQSLHNSVNKIRVINRAEIERRAPADVYSLLRLEPGIRISNDLALQESDIEMMGISGASVKVLLNGLPLRDNSATKMAIGQLDINSIERIEIVEGPMSIVYGSDALSGVINIITKKASEKPSINLTIHEESIGKNYSFFHGEGMHSQRLSANWSHKCGGYVKGGFTRNQNGGWQGNAKGRERQWSPKRQNIYGFETGIRKEQFSANYFLTFINEEITNPVKINPNFPHEERSRKYLIDRYTHNLRSVWAPSNKLKVEYNGSYQTYSRNSHTEVYHSDTKEKDIEKKPGTIGYDSSGFNYFFSKLSATWSINRKTSLQSGIDYERDVVFGGRVEGQRPLSNLSLYALLDWKFTERLQVTAGLRKNLYSNFEAPLITPSVQTKLGITKSSDLRLSYSHGYRTPKAREMFFSLHDAVHNVDGNPNLKPEYSRSLKSSYTWRIIHEQKMRLTTILGGYINSYTDFISMVEDENEVGHFINMNTKEHKTIGTSLETSFSYDKISASGSFLLLGLRSRHHNENSMTGKENIYLYSPEFNLLLSYQPIKQTTLNLSYKYTGKRSRYFYTGGTDEYRLGSIEAFSWLDFTASHKIGKHLTLRAGAKNILNVISVKNTGQLDDNPHGGGEKGATPLACGRSFFASLNYTF